MATGNAMATTFGLLGDEMDLTKELQDKRDESPEGKAASEGAHEIIKP